MGLGNPFDGTDLVSRIAMSHDIAPGLAGMYQLVDILWREYGLDPLEISHATFSHFLAMLGRHPFAYVATVVHNFQLERLANLLLNPLANLNDFLQLGPRASARVIPGVRELREMPRAGLFWNAATFGPPLLALEIVALAGLAVLAIGTPLMALRRRRSEPPGRHRAAAFLWLTFMGVIGAFALAPSRDALCAAGDPGGARLARLLPRWRAMAAAGGERVYAPISWRLVALNMFLYRSGHPAPSRRRPCDSIPAP